MNQAPDSGNLAGCPAPMPAPGAILYLVAHGVRQFPGYLKH